MGIFSRNAATLQKRKIKAFDDSRSLYYPKMEFMQLFRDCALITASFDYKPEDSDNIFILDMPPKYDENTVSIKAEGIKYDSINHFCYNEKQLKGDKVKEYKDQQEILENKMENLKEYMKSRSQNARSLDEFLNIQSEGECEYSVLQEQKKRLKEELTELIPDDGDVKYGFSIHLSGRDKQECRVYLQYTVSSIYWKPSCVINAIPKENKIIMEAMARIYSSVRFENVMTTLITGENNIWRTPSLNDCVLERKPDPAMFMKPLTDEFEPENPFDRGFRSFFKRREKSDNDFDDELDDIDEDDFIDEDFDDDMADEFEDSLADDDYRDENPEDDFRGFNFNNIFSAAESNFTSTENYANQSREYTLKEPLSSEGNGDSQSVVLESVTIDAQPEYMVIPKLSFGAYIVMHAEEIKQQYKELIGTESLADNVSIRLDGRSVRTETAENAFGNSNVVCEYIRGIRATRVTWVSKSSKSSFGKKMTVEEGYSINVENKLDKEAEIVIYDNIPVTQDPDIEIRIKEDTGAELDAQTGRAKWKKLLAPQENCSITVEYTVTYPADVKVQMQRKW